MTAPIPRLRASSTIALAQTCRNTSAGEPELPAGADQGGLDQAAVRPLLEIVPWRTAGLLMLAGAMRHSMASPPSGAAGPPERTHRAELSACVMADMEVAFLAVGG